MAKPKNHKHTPSDTRSLSHIRSLLESVGRCLCVGFLIDVVPCAVSCAVKHMNHDLNLGRMLNDRFDLARLSGLLHSVVSCASNTRPRPDMRCRRVSASRRRAYTLRCSRQFEGTCSFGLSTRTVLELASKGERNVRRKAQRAAWVATSSSLTSKKSSLSMLPVWNDVISSVPGSRAGEGGKTSTWGDLPLEDNAESRVRLFLTVWLSALIPNVSSEGGSVNPFCDEMLPSVSQTTKNLRTRQKNDGSIDSTV